MSGPTVHAIKRAVEEIRDELTEATTHGSGRALVWPLGCDIVANSPTILTMLANKLKAPPMTTNPTPDAITCPWCSKPICPGEPTGMSNGERMHLWCAAEDMDNATFDRDMGFD